MSLLAPSLRWALALLLVQTALGAPRQRVLLDADWRFYRGEVPGAPFSVQGQPITHWRWQVAEAGATNADTLAAPDLDTSGPDWKDATTGEDVFKGRVGFAWYRTPLPEGRSTPPLLHFEGVDDNATVYLNGRRLAHHAGWNESFDVALKPAWNPAGPNLLAVLVQNTEGIGGITAPVWLQQPEQDFRASGPAAPEFNDSSWRTVHLPHDFIVEGTFDPKAERSHGFLPTTNGWYRKTFALPASAKGKSVWLDFDGIYRNCFVWLNGQFLGHHYSGYTSFRFDIGAAAHYGGKNVLAVYVDPRFFEGWWYEGGGIYRHVWLNIADPVHMQPWGTFVTTQLPEPSSTFTPPAARVSIQTALTNAAASDTSATLVSRILNDEGTTVATLSTPVRLSGGSSQELTQQATVTQPRLWSIEAPHLYRVLQTIRAHGKTLDTVETPFGIRTIRFDAANGFFLNGKPVKIQGTCNHQDFAGIGIAVPDSLQYWRVRKLQAMGANAWRMSHNPPAPALLDACDQLGMLVMDENRHLGDSDANLEEVVSMVQRDRNHPSIIMWSMCNEEPASGTEAGGRMFVAMKATVLKHDPTRPVSSAMNSGWFEKGFTQVEDLMGVNYNTQVYDRFHREHPLLPMYASETASTLTTRGEYADNREQVRVSSYHLTDETWRSVAERPFIAGSFVWTGFDYKGEPTPYDWPCINSHFGILDLCGFPKDNYYYYLAWWKTNPVVHLLPHWNWPGKEGKEIKVIAFSNCERVELFVNGVSLGQKPVPRYGHVEWTAKYAPGTLSAKGFNGNLIAVSTQVETTGAPASLRLKTERTELRADGEDLAPVKVEVLDAQGRVVPTADHLVTFDVTGPGHVAGVGNGNPGDHAPDKASQRHAFNGKCLVLVGTRAKPGSLRLTATAPGLQPATLTLRAVAR
jgi:beta-galactosidase